jgi:RNA polymerase sigma-70 factor, ECF subfamily
VKDKVALCSAVDRAKQGDINAFGELYELFFDGIYRYAYASLGTREGAEDVASRTFLKALEGIDRFKWRGGGFSSWLYRIAHNCVMDQFRGTRREADGAPDDEADRAFGPSETAELNDEIRAVLDEIKLLTADQRQVLLLRYLGELSTAEIAAIMGRTEAGVRTIQHRGLVALRSKLKVKIVD